MFERISRFLREVRNELSKVTWPSRKEILASTAVVLVFVLISSVYLGAVDWLISWIVRMLLQ